MAGLLQITTPKWENSEVIWSQKDNDSFTGGGYVYLSVRTTGSVLGEVRGEYGKNLVRDKKLVPECNAATLIFLSEIFLYDLNTQAWLGSMFAERPVYLGEKDDSSGNPVEDWLLWETPIPHGKILNENNQLIDPGDPCDYVGQKDPKKTVRISNQATAVLTKLIVDDKNIAPLSCFKNSLLFKMSFDDLISLSGGDDFEFTKFQPRIKALLGLEKPKPIKDEYDPSQCPPEVKDAQATGSLGGPPRRRAGGAKGGACESAMINLGIPEKSRPLCADIRLAENVYLTQTDKEKEDQVLKDGCAIIECTINATKGKDDFVTNKLVPGPPPCGAFEDATWQELQATYDYMVANLDMKKFAKKAAACAGIDLPIEELERILSEAFLRALSCEQIMRIFNGALDLIGFDLSKPPAGMKDLMNQQLGIINGVLTEKVLVPLIDTLPADEIRKISELPGVGTAPHFIGEAGTTKIDMCKDLAAKMPQEVDDIAAKLTGMDINELWTMLDASGLRLKAMLMICEDGRDEIIQQIKDLLDFNLCGTNNPVPSDAPIRELAQKVNNNLKDPKTKRRRYDRKLMRKFQNVAKIKVDGYYGPQTVGAMIHYGISDAPAKQYRGKDVFQPPIPLPPAEGDPRDCMDVLKDLLAQALGITRQELDVLWDIMMNIDWSWEWPNFEKPNWQFDIKFPKFKLPKFPTITLPKFPTTDVLAGMADEMANAITEGLKDAVLSMVMGILKAVCEACEKGAIGDLDIGKTIEDSAKSSFSAAALSQVRDKLLGDLKAEIDKVANQSLFDGGPTFGQMGAVVGQLNKPSNVSMAGIGASVEGLVRDTSSILKPGQAAQLLLGSAPDDVTEAIECILEKPEYATIHLVVKDPVSINKLFAEIGNLVDKEILVNAVDELTKLKSPDGEDIPLDCPSPQEEIDRTALEDFSFPDGSKIPTAEIDKQLEKAKDRQKKRFKELMDIAAKDDPLEDVLPTPECEKNARGDKKPSFAPKDPPVAKSMIRKTVDGVYDGVYMAFNEDITAFPDAISTTSPQIKIIPRTKTSIDSDGDEIVYVNPELRRMASDGIIIPDWESGDTDNADDQEGLPSFQTKISVFQVAPKLKGFLNDFEANDDLFKFRPSDGAYRLTVQNQIRLDKFQAESLKKMEGSSGIDFDRLTREEEFRIDYIPERTTISSEESYSIKVNSWVSSSYDPIKETGGEITGSIFTTSSVGPASKAVTNVRTSGSMTAPYGPKQDFGNFLKAAWLSGSGASVVPGMLEFQHDEIFNDIMANISKQCAKSSFFDRTTLMLVDFIPQLTQEQRNCGCSDPHLLNLDEIKNEVIEDYEKSQCSTPLTPTDDPAVGPLETAGLGGIVQTIIRLYLVELSLRAIFVLSEFPLGEGDKVLDDLIQSYFSELIVKDIQKQDKQYSREFQRQAILFHNNKAQEKDWDRTNEAVVAIKDLISVQYRSVILRLTEILGKDFAGYDMKNILATNWLPLFDVPSTPTEGRFSKPGMSFFDSPQSKFRNVKYSKEVLTANEPNPYARTIPEVVTHLNNLADLVVHESGSEIFQGEKFNTNVGSLIAGTKHEIATLKTLFDTWPDVPNRLRGGSLGKSSAYTTAFTSTNYDIVLGYSGIRDWTGNHAETYHGYKYEASYLNEAKTKRSQEMSRWFYWNKSKNLKMSDSLVSLKDEIDYYKKHMVIFDPDLAATAYSKTPIGVTAIGDLLDKNRLYYYEKAFSDGTIAVQNETQLDTERIMEYAEWLYLSPWAKSGFLEGDLWIKEVKRGLMKYYRDQNITASLQSLESVSVGVTAREFKLNFLWQQRRFWERIQTYNKWFGKLSWMKIDLLWSSPDVNGPFTPNPTLPEGQQQGRMEKVFTDMNDAVIKRIQSYGGPSAGLSTLKNISSFGNTQPFNLNNGNLILEKYIDKKAKNIKGSETGQREWDKGLISIDRFKEYLTENYSTPVEKSKLISEEFDGNIKVGLRLTYVPPLDPGGFTDPARIDSFDGEMGDAAKGATNAVIKKAYNLIEEEEIKKQMALGNIRGEEVTQRNLLGLPTDVLAQRRISTIPLFNVEKTFFPPDPTKTIGGLITDLSKVWERQDDDLMTQLQTKDEFKFLFDYSFPLKRILFLVMLYNMTYFEFDKEVINLFNSTKAQLKTVFYALLNANNPDYEDPTIKAMGGVAGMAASLQKNLPSASIVPTVAKMVAKAPLLMLKGMTELTDPCIGIAKKVHDGAVMAGVDIPMPLAALMSLPMNVIPPPPIGPGIGPPITPMGFAYLAFDAASSLLSPEELALLDKQLAALGGPDLEEAKKKCLKPKPPGGE